MASRRLGESGCVAWMFTKRGLITVEKRKAEEDQLIEVALEVGAEDVADTGETFEVATVPEYLDTVREAMKKQEIAIASAEVTMVPQNTVTLSGKEAEQTLKLLEALQDHDDVQDVSANLDIAQEELERIGAG